MSDLLRVSAPDDIVITLQNKDKETLDVRFNPADVALEDGLVEIGEFMSENSQHMKASQAWEELSTRVDNLFGEGVSEFMACGNKHYLQIMPLVEMVIEKREAYQSSKVKRINQYRARGSKDANAE